jgi:hypothetical protein
MRWIYIAFLLVGLVLLIGSPALAAQDTPLNMQISISPFRGEPGSEITVSGSGADPSLQVIVTLAPQVDSAAGALATVELTPAADGTFETTLTVPTDVPDGRYAVRAEQFTPQGLVLHYYWNMFSVSTASPVPAEVIAASVPLNMQISISPFRGEPGSEIAVSGGGADPSLQVIVTLAPQVDSAAGALTTVELTPAADGTFETTLTVPTDVPDGRYAIRAEQFSLRGNVLQYYWNVLTVGEGGAGPVPFGIAGF